MSFLGIPCTIRIKVNNFNNQRKQVQQMKRLQRKGSSQIIEPINEAHEETFLNAQILRLQTQSLSKESNQIWYLHEKDICDYFDHYPNLPLSRVRVEQLVGKSGVRIVKSENKIFLGEVMNRKKHGKGITIYKDGRIYEGEFYCNEKNGYGCQLYTNGNFYFGEFSQNKKHGKGSFYWFSLCSPACSKGSESRIEQYHGTWWGGLPDGQGEHQKVNGDFYVGGFKNGLKHGDGVEHYHNMDIYKGEYMNGMAEGYGEYVWANGETYKGDFKQGYRNGYGVWETKNGKSSYKGHYLLDRKHGYGIFDEGKGIVYKGNYFEDERSGQGELYEGQKMIYSGLWENGNKMDYFESQPTTRRKSLQGTIKTERGSYQSNSNFRVKTASRGNYSSTKKSLKDEFQINFKRLVPDDKKSHRGCTACLRREGRKKQREKLMQNNPEDL